MFGCEYRRKEGSHQVLTYPGAKRAIVIPEYDEIDIEIIKNNMRTVGMTREQYFDLLKELQVINFRVPVYIHSERSVRFRIIPHQSNS